MKQFTFHCTKKKVFEAIKLAAASLDLDIRSESLVGGTLTLFSSGGLFSYGNKIDVEIKHADRTKSILKVSSRSAASIQIVDWGTNSDLEDSIIEEVKSILN